MTSNDGPLTGILIHFTYKEEMHLTNICLKDFPKKKKKKKKKRKTLDGELSSDFVWVKAVWSPAFWRLLELKILIRHIVINDCLDFHVVKQMWKYIHRLFCNSISNLLLRFFLRSVYIKYTHRITW